MKYYPDDGGGLSDVQAKIGLFVRCIANLLGLLLILIGLYYTFRTYSLIHSALTEPEGLSGVFEQWSNTLGGDKLDVQIGDSKIPLSRTMSVSMVSGGVVCLCWMSLAIMLAGAKIVSWTVSDREAIKKILQYSLGSDPQTSRRVEIDGEPAKDE